MREDGPASHLANSAPAVAPDGNWRIGIDTGGTFTDICGFDVGTGDLRVWKTPSTPHDPSQAIGHGLQRSLDEFGGDAGAIAFLGHGTTVATNALIQDRIAPTGLITTAGFRDLLEIARQQRPSLYDLQCDKPVPIVPRRHRIEVPERLRHDGRIETRLDENAVREAAKGFRDAGVKAVAVAFLYAYVDSSHERAARRIIEEVLPEAFVCCSHEVAPEFREFERFSTVAVNAALGPVMSGYITRVGERIAGLGVRAKPHITQSNGGVISFGVAARQPVRTVLSGPSTGVIGAVETGRLAGEHDLITFDMGGTSTDVSLVQGACPTRAGARSVAGRPLLIPMLDIETVGAGGGSIAHVDSGGLLKVGPQSAGADPGPACYGLGAEAPTVTDANVVLGTLHPDHLLRGRMPIHQRLAREAVARLGERIDLSVEATAQGIVAVVTANMAKAIRVISVRRGHDPRRFAMVAFGGAGPLHASRLARELEIPRIVIPPHPGVQCAVGLLQTDLAADFARTNLVRLDDAESVIDAEFNRLSDLAGEWLDAEGVAARDRLLIRAIDMRYAGQNYELRVAMPSDAGDGRIGALRHAFEAEHRRMYGYIAEEEPVQLVTFRLQAVGTVPKSAWPRASRAGNPAGEAQEAVRRVYLPEAEGYVECPVFDRGCLGRGHRLQGPAIVEQMDATTLVLPGQSLVVDAYRNMVLGELQE